MFKSPRAAALIALATVAGIGLSAAPAMAKPGESKTRMTVKQQDGETVYCVTRDDVTGTRMPRKLCQNRADWARDGVNIPLDGRASGSRVETPKG